MDAYQCCLEWSRLNKLKMPPTLNLWIQMTHCRTMENCLLYCSTHPAQCLIFEFSNNICSVSTTSAFFKWSRTSVEKTVWYNPASVKITIKGSEFNNCDLDWVWEVLECSWLVGFFYYIPSPLNTDGGASQCLGQISYYYINLVGLLDTKQTKQRKRWKYPWLNVKNRDHLDRPNEMRCECPRGLKRQWGSISCRWQYWSWVLAAAFLLERKHFKLSKAT